MDRVVIHHHNVPAFERRHEQLFHKEQHRVAIDRTGDTQARTHPLQAHRADGRHVAALISRDLIEDPLARGGTTVQSGQAQIAAYFVNKEEVLTRKTISELTKLLAGLVVSLTGDQTFFSEAASVLVSHGRLWTD
jgi:hypothetical protein